MTHIIAIAVIFLRVEFGSILMSVYNGIIRIIMELMELKFSPTVDSVRVCV